MRLSVEETLAAATGSTGGLGVIGTMPAAATLYVRCNCGENTERVLWQVKADKSHSVQLYRARTNVTGGTITFTDATAVDADDTFVFNGLTFTFKAGANVLASRYIGLGADNAAAAVNCAAMLADPTYGVPGIGAIVVTSPGSTDVLTIAAGTAPVYQFGQGTSAANEVAWVSTTVTSLVRDGGAYSGVAADTTTAGYFLEQFIEGWDYAYIGITNNDAVAAMTPIIKATRYH